MLSFIFSVFFSIPSSIQLISTSCSLHLPNVHRIQSTKFPHLHHHHLHLFPGPLHYPPTCHHPWNWECCYIYLPKIPSLMFAVVTLVSMLSILYNALVFLLGINFPLEINYLLSFWSTYFIQCRNFLLFHFWSNHPVKTFRHHAF